MKKNSEIKNRSRSAEKNFFSMIFGKKNKEMKSDADRNIKKNKQKNQNRMPIYLLAGIAIIFLLGLLICLKSVGYPAVLTEIRNKEKVFATRRVDVAKEDLLINSDYSAEDPISEIKNVDFEKLTFEKNIPILMYHYVEPESASQSALRRSLGVTPDNFAKQMKWLYDNSYQTLTLSQFFSLIAKSQEVPAKTVLITFDDGYEDFFDNAVPILHQYNMTATMFVITDKVDSTGYLTWDQIKQLSDQGIEFDSHSLTHPNLTTIKDDKLKNEVEQSKAKIEDEIGKTVNFFCYPTGAFDARVEKAVLNAGYRGSFTTINGYKVSNKDMFELPRVRITHMMSLQGFAWTINSAQ